MASHSSERPAFVPRPPSEPGRYSAATRGSGGGQSSSGLLAAGLVAAGLGVLAWYYLGPDVRRYLKIRRM